MPGTVDIGQIRSVCQGVPAQTHVLIQAGTLLALVNLVRGLQGTEANLTVSTLPSDRHPLNLTNFHT